jgi:hypothetical protein
VGCIKGHVVPASADKGAGTGADNTGESKRVVDLEGVVGVVGVVLKSACDERGRTKKKKRT